MERDLLEATTANAVSAKYRVESQQIRTSPFVGGCGLDCKWRGFVLSTSPISLFLGPLLQQVGPGAHLGAPL